MKKHYTIYCLLCFFIAGCGSWGEYYDYDNNEDSGVSYGYGSEDLDRDSPIFLDMNRLSINEDDEESEQNNSTDSGENCQYCVKKGEDEFYEQEDLASDLQDAISSSDLKLIKKCLQDIDDDHLLESPDLTDEKRTFLHEAAEQEDIEVFKMVLEEGYGNRRDIDVQEEIAKIDGYGNSVLSMAIKNDNWELCDYLHGRSNLAEDTLKQLYQSLSNIDTNADLIKELLVRDLLEEGDGIQFLPYLFTYNDDLAERVANNNDWEDPFRARFYYLLSQWKGEQGGDISKLVDTDGYMEKAINLASEDPDERKLYMAYKAILLLALGKYIEAESLANSAGDIEAIEADTTMAEFFICYVKTICNLEKKKYKEYVAHYSQMIENFHHISHNEQSIVKNKLSACFGELETKINRKATVNATTVVASAVKQNGKISKLFGERNIVKRPYRTFEKGERLAQLLKQLATQLYFSATRQEIKLKELQIMYCQINGKTKLFIAANELENATKFFEILHKLKANELVQLFTSAYSPNWDPEGTMRSRRYSKKLKKLFNNDLNERFGSGKKPDYIHIISKEFNSELKHIENVLTILQEGRSQLLPLAYENVTGIIRLDKPSQELVKKAITSVECQLYLITGQCTPHRTPHPKRHAEEFLCDIFELTKDSRSCYDRSCIAGRMRPCVGCSGRMKAVGIVKFNPRPGKLWLHTIENQPSDVARESIEILFKKPNHISLSKGGEEKPSYDSGSESDVSDEDGKNKNDKSKPRIRIVSSTGKKSSQPSDKHNKSIDNKQESGKKTSQQTTNIEYNGKLISPSYWYEDKDILRILTIELSDRRNQTIYGTPIYILGPLDNVSTYSLKDALNSHQRKQGIVLIPFNLGLSHWVGLILEYAFGKLIRADYYDPLGGSIPVYLNRILRAHNEGRYDRYGEELIAFTRIRGSQLVGQENGYDCGPCTIANLLKNADISYQEDPNITPVRRRLNHLQLLENSDPEFYNDFYDRQCNNRHSFSENFNYKEKTLLVSPNEYEALMEIAKNIKSIPSLEKQFRNITDQNSDEHCVVLTKLRSLLNSKENLGGEEQKAINTIAKRIFYLDIEPSIDMAPLRIEYDHLPLLVKIVYSLETQASKK